MASKIVSSLLAVSILVEIGCSSTRMLTEEELRTNADRDILVATIDGRTILFKSGNYKITEAGLGSIEGKGKLIINESAENSRDFEDTIPFSEIQKITSARTSDLAKIAAIVIIGTSVILVWLLSTRLESHYLPGTTSN